MAEKLLDVRDLHVHFATEDGVVRAVDGVSFELERGKVLGIVGESGSGKSVTAMTLLGLTRDQNTRFEGEVLYKGRDVLTMDEGELQEVRGNEMSMIFQDPMTSLNPVYTIGAQICEAIQVHERADKNTARRRAIDLLKQVGIPNADSRVNNYPHEFSGGMRQRAMIAMALICEPELLIADEPTTALDVTVQAQILDLISSLQQETGSAVVYVTHDLGVVAEVCQRVIVMYGGQCVEQADMEDAFLRTAHPYTKGLLASMPSMADEAGRLTPIPGFPPSLLDLPQGCLFADRCPVAHLVPGNRCRTERPALHGAGSHRSRCHLSEGLGTSQPITMEAAR